MNRLETTFADLRESGRKGLVGYLTAGDPDLEQSERDIRDAIAAGMDVLELGVPFSDPTADGPTIQAAAKRALESGMTLKKALDMVRRLRADGHELPVVLFGYANPLLNYGYEALCADAAEAGVDGLLVVDLPYEEADELQQHMDLHDLLFVPLIAPTTGSERMRTILAGARGFVYYIMVTGVTGARLELATDISDQVKTLRTCTELPIAVGFGVSSGEMARAAGDAADAVVVGSALIKAAREGRLTAFVTELRAGLDS